MSHYENSPGTHLQNMTTVSYIEITQKVVSNIGIGKLTITVIICQLILLRSIGVVVTFDWVIGHLKVVVKEKIFLVLTTVDPSFFHK